jgi:transcriptional regulator with XRE-family HTH domain
MQDALRPLTNNLQRLRRERGLSLSLLARKAQLSKSTLSKLEHGKANPSMDTLWSLANALDVPFASLFIEESDRPLVEVLRHVDATRVIRDGRGAFVPKHSTPHHDPHFVIRHILSRHPRGELEVYCVDITAATEREAAPHSKDVVEHVFVVTGRVEVRIGEIAESLDEGDRMTFAADRPHSYRSLDGRDARIVTLLDYP